MFGWKRKQIQKALPPIVATNEYELGSALLSAFRGSINNQQTCLHCHARGGFEMSHHENCIIDAAASRLFRHAKWDSANSRYVTFEERT